MSVVVVVVVVVAVVVVDSTNPRPPHPPHHPRHRSEEVYFLTPPSRATMAGYLQPLPHHSTP